MWPLCWPGRSFPHALRNGPGRAAPPDRADYRGTRPGPASSASSASDITVGEPAPALPPAAAPVPRLEPDHTAECLPLPDPDPLRKYRAILLSRAYPAGLATRNRTAEDGSLTRARTPISRQRCRQQLDSKERNESRISLSLSLLAQTAPTMVTEVAGTIQSYDLYWDASGHLWLELGVPRHDHQRSHAQAAGRDRVRPLDRHEPDPGGGRRGPSRDQADQRERYDRAALRSVAAECHSRGPDPAQVTLGYLFGAGTVAPWILAPYSFLAFDYGATHVLTLNGDAATILAVLKEMPRRSPVPRASAFAVTENNSLLNPHAGCPSTSGYPGQVILTKGALPCPACTTRSASRTPTSHSRRSDVDSIRQVAPDLPPGEYWIEEVRIKRRWHPTWLGRGPARVLRPRLARRPRSRGLVPHDARGRGVGTGVRDRIRSRAVNITRADAIKLGLGHLWPKKTTGSSSMNKMEHSFWMDMQDARKTLVFDEVYREPFKLRLAGNTFYTPDFFTHARYTTTIERWYAGRSKGT